MNADLDAMSLPRERGLSGKLMRRLATPLTTGLFVVSATSGIALFFRWLPSAFHSMHIWLSMVLLVPFALHVWRNWRPLIGYARRGTLLISLVACVAGAVPFAVSGMNGAARRGDNPAFRALTLLTQARLVDLAPVLRTTPAGLVATLEQRGYASHSVEDTLESVAVASGKKPAEVLAAVFSKRQAGPGREDR